jgi:hypothetical protein
MTMMATRTAETWCRRLMAAALVCCISLTAGTHAARAEEAGSRAYFAGPRCQPISVADLGGYHLSADALMEIAMGTWGRSVHPLGPEYFRVNRHLRQQGKSITGCSGKM